MAPIGVMPILTALRKGCCFHVWEGTMSNSVFRYYGDESKQFSFCRIPHRLITNDCIEQLSAITCIHPSILSIGAYYWKEDNG